MSNTNPSDFDCDCGDLCTSCGCSECGRKTEPDTRGPLTLVSGKVVQACAECRAAEAADSGGVPVAVAEEQSGAQTVRLKADPSIKETGVEWADKLGAAVAL
jgi:hypothetical protein